VPRTLLGTSAEFWLNLQSLYELRLAQKKAGPSIRTLPTLKRASLFTSGDLYDDFLGGDPGHLNASQGFGNWSGADSTALGINAQNFGIYVWSIHSSTFGANDALDFVGNGIPVGSFILGF
jgi:hypothetical protein